MLDGCFFVASCIIYTSIDCHVDLQVEELRKALREYSNGTLSMVQLPRLSEHIQWLDAVVARKMSRHMDLVAIMLDKTICALSHTFLGSIASTFSQDIQRMRMGLGTYSCGDSTICLGEKEWVRNRG